MNAWAGLTNSGLRRGSVRTRWAQASTRMFAVVVELVILDRDNGVEDDSVGEASRVAGLLATTREVSGDRSGAFVALGLARRATARDLGLGVVTNGEAWAAGGVSAPAGSAMSPTALGVGVAGGGMVAFWARRLGVDGAAVESSPLTAAGCGGEAFLLREIDLGAGEGGGGIEEDLFCGFAPAWALRRADLRPVIVRVAPRWEPDWT